MAVAEIGDKTQLLSFALAARLRRPWPIITGILLATLANHALAGTLGVWLATLAPPAPLRLVTAAAFVLFGVWALRPDTLDGPPGARAAGAFISALTGFFLAEMGDKTQLATIALAARFQPLAAVILGTTFGMMIANVPAVFIGEKLSDRLPMKHVRWLASALFILAGLASLLDLHSRF